MNLRGKKGTQTKNMAFRVSRNQVVISVRDCGISQ